MSNYHFRADPPVDPASPVIFLFHGTGGDSELRRYLAGAEALEVAEDQDLLLDDGHLGKQIAHPALIIDGGGGRGHGITQYGERPPRGFQPIESAAPRPHEQPCPDGASLRRIVAGAPPGFEEDVVDEVLGLLLIFQHAARQHEQCPDMARVQLRHGGAIACGHARDQRGIGDLLPWLFRPEHATTI